MSNSSAEFAENSVLDFLIPHASEVDIEEALGSSETAQDVDESALITSIPQRSLLFFGMNSARPLQNCNVLLISRLLQMRRFQYMSFFGLGIRMSHSSKPIYLDLQSF